MSLEIWTVYQAPRDMPGVAFAARLWVLDKPTETVLTGATLAEVRAQIPPSLWRMPRQEGDDPCIVECWF